MPTPERRRRAPWRSVVIVLVVALVMGSERWNGPFTFAKIQRAGASLAGADDGIDLGESSGRTVGAVHLTFDDGPSIEWTPEILDVLDEHGADATFFPIGNQVAGGADILLRAVADGHRIGNHTWYHDRLARIDPADFDRTIGRTQDAIEQATGEVPTCLRPPQGVIDDDAMALAEARGLVVEMWTVDPQDWRNPGRRAIVDRVISRVTAGDVILLHDGGGDRSDTVRALDELLERLGAAGFSFTPIPGC